MSFGNTSYQSASPLELQRAQQALTGFNSYKTNLLPQEQKYLGRITNRKNRDNIRLGISGATAARGINAGISRGNQVSMARGINPNSGSFQAQNNGVQGLGIGSAVAGSTVQNKSSYLRGLYGAVQSGQSLINGGTAGLNSAAGIDASQNQSDAAYNNAITAAYGDALGNIAAGAFKGLGGVSGIKAGLSSMFSGGGNSSAFSLGGGKVGRGFGLTVPGLNTGYEKYAWNSPGMRR